MKVTFGAPSWAGGGARGAAGIGAPRSPAPPPARVRPTFSPARAPPPRRLGSHSPRAAPPAPAAPARSRPAAPPGPAPRAPRPAEMRLLPEWLLLLFGPWLLRKVREAGCRSGAGSGAPGSRERKGLRAPAPPPAPSVPTLRGAGARTDRLPSSGRALSQRKLAEGGGRVLGCRPAADLAPGAAGEGTEPDPRVRQTERECETDRQASGVSALPAFRANLTRLPSCLSLHPSAPAFPFLFSALATVPGGHRVPIMHGLNTRAHTRTHTDTGELGYYLPFPAETPSPLQDLTDTPLSRARLVGGGGCLEGVFLLPPPPCPRLPRLPLFLRLQGEDPEAKGAQT